MGLETGTYISDLVSTNPTAGDPVAQGDDHMRLKKAALLATFPNITGPVTLTHTELNALDGMFTGSVHFFAANAAPTGFLKANGALVSRATYARLWTFAQASGNIAASDAAWVDGQFSPGDGATTFRIPELRGEFVRGWDDARGIDSGRAIGTEQADELEAHSHTTGQTGTGLNGSVAVTGSTVGVIGAGGTSTGNTGGTETRPRNIALLACIKT